jgi:hypothetical protein
MEDDAVRPLAVLGRAPELVGVDPWLNTPDGEPLKLAALRDRVVLLEFWTFACVNCQLHSPEYAFERSVQNVERAAREHGLEFPVGLDEGSDGRTEAAIRALLADAVDDSTRARRCRRGVQPNRADQRADDHPRSPVSDTRPSMR